ncbi:MAG TPA: response regulator [bacterium]|nr:response regulator [bacterium]HPN44696.1 response regulator [bacterium]
MKNSPKVMIVEDEAITAKCLKMDLEELGIIVLNPVAKGEDAVKIALQEKPNLILMDIRLAGGMDGVEAAEEIIRQMNIPIVFMSGFATDYIKQRTIKTQPIEFLAKPVDIYKIIQIIKALQK